MVDAASLSLPGVDSVTSTGGAATLTGEPSANRTMASSLIVDAEPHYHVVFLSRRNASPDSLAVTLGAGRTALASFGFSSVGTIGTTVSTTANRPAVDAA